MTDQPTTTIHAPDIDLFINQNPVAQVTALREAYDDVNSTSLLLGLVGQLDSTVYRQRDILEHYYGLIVRFVDLASAVVVTWPEVVLKANAEVASALDLADSLAQVLQAQQDAGVLIINRV